MIYEILDMPEIPKDVDLKEYEPLLHTSDIYKTGIRIYTASPSLLLWFKEHFGELVSLGLGIGIMVIEGRPDSPELGLHVDANNRQFAFNYIIDAGGDDVRTNCYEKLSTDKALWLPMNDRKELKSVRCEEGKWYLLETWQPHNVLNMSRYRRMITVCPNQKFSRNGADQQKMIQEILKNKRLREL